MNILSNIRSFFAGLIRANVETAARLDRSLGMSRD